MATNALQKLLGQSYREGMTLDEVSAEFEKLGLSDVLKTNKELEAQNTALKAATSKANSEAADYKKQLRAKQSEAEQKEADTNETLQKLQEQLEEMKHEKLVSDTVAKFASAGYSDPLKVANAYISGDLDAFLSAQSDLIKNKEDAFKADLIKNTPRPQAGGSAPKAMTEEELYKMPFEDRMHFIQEHREEYEKIVGNGNK